MRTLLQTRDSIFNCRTNGFDRYGSVVRPKEQFWAQNLELHLHNKTVLRWCPRSGNPLTMMSSDVFTWRTRPSWGDVLDFRSRWRWYPRMRLFRCHYLPTPSGGWCWFYQVDTTNTQIVSLPTLTQKTVVSKSQLLNSALIQDKVSVAKKTHEPVCIREWGAWSWGGC